MLQVYAPCQPCIHDCDVYSCDSNCKADVTIPLTWTLDNLNLTTTNDTDSVEYIPAVYYFTGNKTCRTVIINSFKYNVIHRN